MLAASTVGSATIAPIASAQLLKQDPLGEVDCTVIEDAIVQSDCHHIQALDAQDQGNLQAAIESYTLAIQANPRSGDSYYNRGVAYYDLGYINEAIADYTNAIAINAQDEDAFYNRGLARYDQGDIQGAIADFSATIRINPDASDAQGWLEYIDYYH
jgi:tetratricopeptide (TPR) repeat protein